MAGLGELHVIARVIRRYDWYAACRYSGFGGSATSALLVPKSIRGII
jgi:hypothetical protein